MDYKLALAKEKTAAEQYKKLSLRYPAMRNLFNFLMNEEEKHVRLIQRKIAELYK